MRLSPGELSWLCGVTLLSTLGSLSFAEHSKLECDEGTCQDFGSLLQTFKRDHKPAYQRSWKEEGAHHAEQERLVRKIALGQTKPTSVIASSQNEIGPAWVPTRDGGLLKFCPQEDAGRPAHCPQGNQHWTLQQLKIALPEFINMYRNRPGDLSLQSPNHAFALWFTVRQLRPKYIIESGVYEGGSTWLMRQAAGNDTMIISLDPAKLVRWWDTWGMSMNKTHYLLQSDFRDLSEMNWDEYIPKAERDLALVMLDDHQSVMKRVKKLLELGFTHTWSDDNYHYDEPGADCYTFNMVCAPLADTVSNGTVTFRDNFNEVVRQIQLAEHKTNRDYLTQHIDVYFEFPPLWNGVCSDPSELLELPDIVPKGLPSVKSARFNYYTSHPPYVKLRP